MDDIDFAKTLFSDQLETLSGTKARTVAAVTEKASTTTTTIAQAMDDSSNGYVLVDLGGKTISKDATQFIDADTSETNQHAVTLPTTVTVYSGDKVMVSCIGASGTAKKVVVTGVVGGGDRISVKLSDVNELAKEIDAKVVSATTDLENTKTEMENFEKSVPNIYSTKDEITAFKENVNTTYATKKERADGDEAITTKLTTEYTNNTDLSAKYATQTLVSQTKDDITQSVSSTYATKTALNGVKSTADTNTTDLTNYITSNNKEITSLQNQIDGSIQTWFYEVVPTNDNVPASNWTTTALKNNHLGDLYYDTITGYCYRYQVANNVYGWTRITDVDVTKALADAAKAQDTADHKRRIFVTTPTVPYDVGDLWTQGSGGDVLRCKTAKTASQTYDASDWELASKYTDDTAVTALSNTVTTTYATKAEVKTTTDAISATVSDNYTKSTNYTDGKIATEVQDRNAAITEKADSITSTVSSTYATKTALATTDSKASTASSDASTALSTANSASSAAATANTNATAAKNTANTAATNASTAITTSNTAKTTADTAKSTADTAKSTADTAKATADSTANNLTNNYSTTVQMNSAITQKANEITSTVSATYTPKSDFEGLQVGARNLMLKTGTSDFQSYFNVETGTKSVSGIAMVLTATGASGTRIGYFNLSDMTVPPTSGNNYSISFDALSSVDGGKIKFNYSMTDSNGKAEFTLTTTSKRYSSKMPMSGGSTLSLLNMSAAGQVITISHIKFEAGNKPTDWSPAPEDMLSKAAAEATYATQSSLTQTKDAIEASVSSTYATKTALANTDATANSAKTTADHKRRVFVDTPAPPYDVGDLWAQGSGGDVMRCSTAKTAAQSYAASDWELASKYTDDSAVTSLAGTVATTYATKSDVKATTDSISATVASNLTTAKSYTDGKISTEVTDRNAAIVEKADSITSTVASTYTTKTDFNALQVGGTNLLRSKELASYGNSKDFTGAFWASRIYGTDFVDTLNLSVGDKLTFTCDIEVISAPGEPYTGAMQYSSDFACLYRLAHDTTSASTVTPLGGFQDSSYTIGSKHHISQTCTINSAFEAGHTVIYFYCPMQWNSAKTEYSAYTCRITNMKLERGNKATDWTPAPEDVADGISTAKSAADTAQATANTAKSTADSATTDLTNYITKNKADLASLQSQIDGSIQTWFYEVAPTNDNVPASNWTTTALKNNHLGDLYYDTITGYCYRYQVANNTYGWTRITDVDVTKALSDAAKAQDTADHKRRVFVVTPIPPYDVGDLWAQGSSGDVMRCSTAKTAKQTYASSDWTKASKYTDDTAVTALGKTVSETYATKSQLTSTKDSINADVTSVLTKVTTNYGICTTEGSVVDKVVTLANYPALYTGAKCAVKFSYANTADSPTLNVNGTGAKIIYAYGDALKTTTKTDSSGASITTPSYYSWVDNSIVSFIYNGTQWDLIDNASMKKTDDVRGTANNSLAATIDLHNSLGDVSKKVSDNETAIARVNTSISSITSSYVKNADFQVTTDEIKQSITTTESNLTEYADGQIQKEVEKRETFMKLTELGLLVGKSINDSDSSVIQRLDNDSTEFVYGANSDGSGGSVKGSISVDEASFYVIVAVNRLIVGNFAFIPRSNGNVSFKKVL